MYLPLQPNPDTLLHSNKTTLWMGDLEPWMDETYLQRLFWFNLNVNIMAKVIRDKSTFISCGYAFVDFGSVSAAQCALDMFNGETIPNTTCTFKLNWASGGGLIDKKEDRQPEYSLFLGDLSNMCSEHSLLHIFQSRYMSCKSVKIMTDPRTGQSRGYGFVRFKSPLDQIQALNEMQGCMIGNRPIRVSLATPKNHNSNNNNTTSPFLEHVNTTVFVGGLSCPLKEQDLKQYFEIFGDIIYVKIPPGKGCGFVQFVSRRAAEMAIEQMNGYQIGSSRIRLSWGRSQQQRQHYLSDAISKQSQQQSSFNQLDAVSSSFIDFLQPLHQQQQLNPFDQDLFDDTNFNDISKLNIIMSTTEAIIPRGH